MLDRDAFTRNFRAMCDGLRPHDKPSEGEIESFWVGLRSLTDTQAAEAMDTALRTEGRYFPKPATLLALARERMGAKLYVERHDSGLPACGICGEFEREHYLERTDGTRYYRIMLYHRHPKCSRYNGVKMYQRDLVRETA